jgi:hypothetical protein
MNRLSLEELKAQKNVVANLDAIKGGNLNACHDKWVGTPFTSTTQPPKL